jgi:enoyl-CoA hydratase
MSDTYATLLLRREGALSFVTLHRPEALNAMNAQLVSDLHALFASLRADRSCAWSCCAARAARSARGST